MPQALDEQRDLMLKWFGDSVDMAGPLNFLLIREWKDDAGMLRPPVPSHQPSPYELECIYFLCDEWDFAYGGRAKLF